ncbi:MAG: 30S ribosomal protein S9 [Deltaproteobacteria bacterium]|nr:30S ribosomal protein S9 [Deltaproteobacteria bacterium]
METTIQATGRRKTAVARVRLAANGDGTITVNDKGLEEYFPTDAMRTRVLRPLVATDKQKIVSVFARLHGGGPSAQAGALSHGVSRALLKLDAGMRGILKREGLLTRDDRMKERKKYGQKGARKRFQFSKR